MILDSQVSVKSVQAEIKDELAACQQDGSSVAGDDRSGAQRIVDERQRQLVDEGHTPQHDDRYRKGQLAAAAACYACPVQLFTMVQRAGSVEFVDPWPWDDEYDKRPRVRGAVDRGSQTLEGRVRELEKAGALVAAEIDRLLREIKRRANEVEEE